MPVVYGTSTTEVLCLTSVVKTDEARRESKASNAVGVVIFFRDTVVQGEHLQKLPRENVQHA